MLIKSADDRQGDIDALTALLARPELHAEGRPRIEQEIRTIRAGIAGERDAAYEIDFHYRDLPNRAVIHDLRIEVGGRIAQIDHLMIGRLLDVWVCESKHFAQGVGVNEHGEWVSFWNGKARGIPSPVEQNRRHIAVLNDAFSRGLVQLPKRLGVTLKPQLHSLILVSGGARISRPRTKAAAKRVDGLDTVIKVDQLKTTLDRQIDEMSAVGTFGSLARLISAESLLSIANQLVALHKPIEVDWAARFGLGPVSAVPPRPPAPEPGTAPSAAQAITVPSPLGDQRCASCGSVVSPKVAAYCTANPGRFAGRILCWDCQRPRPKQVADT